MFTIWTPSSAYFATYISDSSSWHILNTLYANGAQWSKRRRVIVQVCESFSHNPVNSNPQVVEVLHIENVSSGPIHPQNSGRQQHLRTGRTSTNGWWFMQNATRTKSHDHIYREHGNGIGRGDFGIMSSAWRGRSAIVRETLGSLQGCFYPPWDSWVRCWNSGI